MDLISVISVIILSTPLLMAVGLVVGLASSGAKDAPPERLPPPSDQELAVEAWLRASPWPELAQAKGWRCKDDRPIYAAAAYRISGQVEGLAFEAVSSVHFGMINFLPERLLVRAMTRKPPKDLLFKGSVLRWDFNSALLKPDQSWVAGQSEVQALEWKAPYLELTLVAPEDPEACVAQAMALFEELRDAEFPFWYQPREGWTLRMDSTGHWPRLSRQVDGRLVIANLEWVQGALRTRIMALIPPQAGRFTLVHPEHAQGAKVEVRNPIVDTLLHASGDTQALHALLEDPRTVEAIMAIVHGHPGSRLTQDRIELIAAGDLGKDLPQAMDEVVQAAQAIAAGQA